MLVYRMRRWQKCVKNQKLPTKNNYRTSQRCVSGEGGNMPFSAASTGIAHTIRSLWQSPESKSMDQRRIQRMRLIGCLTLLALGIGWSAFFAFKSMWGFALLFALFVPCAASVCTLAAHKHADAANVLMFSVCIIAIVGFTLFLDRPTANVQRSIHLFLLPLAVAAFLTFRENRPIFSYGMAGLCLLCFVGLAGSSWTPFPDHHIPETIHTVGQWINGIVASASLFLVLHILHSDATQHSDLDRELQLALKEQQFVLYFQPKIDQHQRVTSAEVLIRWRHPQRGILPPSAFIDHAERSGLMLPLGQWILEQTCQQIQQWRSDPMLSHLELAVNVSQIQFRQNSFATDVLNTVQHYGIPPQQLKLELTETMMVLDMDDLQNKICLLQSQGLRFSLDDFGTGFSSLNHLRQLPLHTLKIDRSFVKDLPQDGNSKTIVLSLLSLAQSLNLTVVAEGVETQAQYDFLAQHGCPRFQGYLFSKPLPVEEFVAFVRSHNTPKQPPALAPQAHAEYA